MKLHTIHAGAIVAFALFLIAEGASAGLPPTKFAPDVQAIDWPVLSKELEQMFETDQQYRNAISQARRHVAASILAQPGAETQQRDDLPTLEAKQRANDLANQARLKEIVDRIGWPNQSRVGAKASLAAWAVLQHAELDFQLAAAPLLRWSVQRGEASKANLAILEDRMLVRQNRKQRYGSQLNGTGLTLYPVEDEATLDARRAAAGLEPICDYLKRFARPGTAVVYASCPKPE